MASGDTTHTNRENAHLAGHCFTDLAVSWMLVLTLPLTAKSQLNTGLWWSEGPFPAAYLQVQDL